MYSRIPGAQARLKIVYSGLWATTANLEARNLGRSFVGLHDLVDGLSTSLPLDSKADLRLAGNFESGSFVSNFVVLWPAISDALINNAKLFDALEKLFGAVAVGGGIAGGAALWIINIRTAKAKERSALAEQRARESDEQLARGRLSEFDREKVERDVIALRKEAVEYQSGSRDAELAAVARFAASANGQVAFQRLLAPVLEGDAAELRVTLASKSFDISAPLTSEALSVHPSVAAGNITPLGGRLDAFEAEIELLGPQLDGSAHNWRFVLEGVSIWATVFDKAFLEAVADNSVELFRGRRFTAVLRKRSESSRSRAYEILTVYP